MKFSNRELELGNLTGWEGTTGFTGAGRALGSLTEAWLRGASFRRAGWKADTLGRTGRANTMGSSGLAAGLKASLELSTSTTLTSGSLTGLGVARLPAPKKVKSDLGVVGAGAGASVVTATGRKVVTMGSATVVEGAAVGLLPRMAEPLGRNLFNLLGSLMPRTVSFTSLSDDSSISLISSCWIWSLGLNLLAPFRLNSLNLGARVVVVVVVVAVVVLTVGASVKTENVCRVGTKAEGRVVTSSGTNNMIERDHSILSWVNYCH